MSEQPTNVVAALARVTAELGGIEKLSADERRKRGMGGGDERGVSYAYRGVDQIAAAAAPLFGKYGVVVVPNVVQQTVEPLTINGKPWTDTAVTVEWNIYGPGGMGDVIQAVTNGLGRDNSDKGPNKALTQSYKNLLLRLLCIGDPADDADGHTHEADARKPQPETTSEHVRRLTGAMNGIKDEAIRIAVKQAFLDQWGKPQDVNADDADDAEMFIADMLAELDKVALPGPVMGEQEEAEIPGSAPAPAPPDGPVVKPATNKPSAAARAALNGDPPPPDKSALGARKPVADEDVAAHFPGSETVNG